ncbi:MAG: TRAP transporter small permease [Oscillospiraceae bacterium]|nr:TRAP transporter small permease [Oscillospiraceae bacterium]
MNAAGKIIGAIEKFIKAVSILDGYIILAMMLMICVDIVMRVMGTSITGSVEITTMAVPVIVFFGVGYTALQGMHIRVDIIKRWPHIDRFTSLLSIVVIAVIGYFCVVQAIQVYNLSTSSTILHIPRWPFVLITAFGMFMVVLAMILNEIKIYTDILRQRGKKTNTLPEAGEEL